MLMAEASYALTIGPLEGHIYFGQPLNVSLLIGSTSPESVSDLCPVVKLVGDSERPVNVSISRSVTVEGNSRQVVLALSTRQKIEDIYFNLYVQVGCQGMVSRVFTILPEISLVEGALEKSEPQSGRRESSSKNVRSIHSGVLPVGAVRDKKPQIHDDLSGLKVRIIKRALNSEINDSSAPSQNFVLKIDWLSDPLQEFRNNPLLKLTGELSVASDVQDYLVGKVLSSVNPEPAIWTMNEAELEGYIRNLSNNVADLSRQAVELKDQYSKERLSGELLYENFQRKENFYIILCISLLVAFIAALVVILYEKRSDKYQAIERRNERDMPTAEDEQAVSGAAGNTDFLSKILRQRVFAKNPEQFDSIFSPNAYLPDRKDDLQASTYADANTVESDFLASRFGESINSIAAEDLFDLQQQVEFFISINQNQKAIDILVARISDEGPISPLAYLDLLRLYHDTGDSIQYEKLRDVFSQKYAAVVPHFSEYAYSRRGLERYPKTVLALQELWASPAAVTFIEDNLFKASNAALDLDVIDLEAYRDLLLLYGVARMIHANSDSHDELSGNIEPVSASVLDVDSRQTNVSGTSYPASSRLLQENDGIDVNLDDIIGAADASDLQIKPPDHSLDFYAVDFEAQTPKT